MEVSKCNEGDVDCKCKEVCKCRYIEVWKCNEGDVVYKCKEVCK